MKMKEMMGKVVGITLVCLLLGAMLGGLTSAVKAADSDSWGQSQNVAVVDDYYASAVGYLYPSDYPNQAFSPLAASQVSAETLANYDTVILYMFNPGLLNAAQKGAINSWVSNGGKLIIWDSNQVPPGSPWDYSWLPYPFTTSVPGQQGATGQGLNILEENQLSSSDPGSPYYIDTAVLNSQTDAVGDANVLTSYGPGWHIDMMATNVLGETGPAHVYAGWGSGLIIYSALDWDYAGYDYPTGAGLKKMLRQELDCSLLPFAAPEIPPEVGLIVEVISDRRCYDVGNTIEFEVTVTNPTDVTGTNVTAYNVLFTPMAPSQIELEIPGACYLLGDIAPGGSESGSFNAMAKTAGDDVEIIVNAYGEDRLLGIPIAGSGRNRFLINDPAAEEPDWSFAIITDLHIGFTKGSGNEYIDYDGAGSWNDSGVGQPYYLTEILENVVQTIKDVKDNYHIKFVVVLGDISDTAEKSELYKAREILNKLNDKDIAYIPLIGNHDICPYTMKPGANHDDRKVENIENVADPRKDPKHKLGDQLFEEVFWNKSDENIRRNLELVEALPNWDKMDVIELPPGSSPEVLYVQNYAFSYEEVKFVCSDFQPRNPAGEEIAYHPLWQLAPTLSWCNAHKPVDGEIAIHLTHDPANGLLWEDYVLAGHVHGNHILPGTGIITTESVSREHNMLWNISKWTFELPPLLSTRTGANIRICRFEDSNIDYTTILTPLGKQIDVLWPSPFFTHTFASYPEPNKKITFTVHYTTYHGFKTSFDWDFGDGSYGSGSSVTHSYAQDGEYTVTLTVSTKNLVTGEETTQAVTGPVYVHSKHVISPLPPSLHAASLLTEEDLTQVPKNTYQPALITKEASGELPIGRVGVHFEEVTEDIDLSSLVADVDLAEKKSVLYMPSWPEEIEEYKTLFIPSTGAGAVYICLGATSLGEVSFDTADIVINTGEAKDGMTVTTTFYNGREYYLVYGITGTGGGEMSGDTAPPSVSVEVPSPYEALQDGVTLSIDASDESGVASVELYIREPDGTEGTPVGWENLEAEYNEATERWEYQFDTTLLPDSNYVLLAKAVDNVGNEGWAEFEGTRLTPFSIRNWAVVELLPASEGNKGGRTMPIKFSLRVAETVDPSQPFVYNEQLEVRIFDAADPENMLQTSLYGTTSRDYRIDHAGEKYITNFKTKKEVAVYAVEIWRTSKNFLIGSFTFETVK